MKKKKIFCTVNRSLQLDQNVGRVGDGLEWFRSFDGKIAIKMHTEFYTGFSVHAAGQLCF